VLVWLLRTIERSTPFYCCQCSAGCQGFWSGFWGMLLILLGSRSCDWFGAIWTWVGLALTFFAKGVTLLTHQLHAIVIRRRHPLEPILLIADTKLLRLKDAASYQCMQIRLA